MNKLTRIHVDQHQIRANYKNGARLPVITVKTYDENRRGTRADLLGADGQVVASVVYSPDKPLACGARVWIETRLEVQIDDRKLDVAA